MGVFGKADNQEREAAAYAGADATFESAPPELPPPFEQHLAYDQLVAELEPVTIERLHEEEGEAGPGRAETETRLHEVMKAAESGEPLEGQLERRHEIKDQTADDDTGGQGSYAASVGQVLSQLHKQTQAAHAAYRYSAANSPGHGLPDILTRLPYIRNLPDLYQRSLLIGAAGGLAVVLIAAIMLLNR